MYPKIPTIKPNPRSGLPRKLPMKDLIDHYNLLVGLGFQVLAKRRTAKFPVQSNWSNLPQSELKGNLQLQIQEKASASGWCVVTGVRSNLTVIDLDFQDIRNGGKEPSDIYEEIQSMSHTSFVLCTPTGGLHLYYSNPDGKSLGSSVRVGYEGVDIRGDGGQVGSLGGFNRYSDNWEKKGVVQNHEGEYSKLPDGEYSSVPVMSETLYNWLLGNMSSRHDTKSAGSNFGSDDMVHNYVHTEGGNRRLEAHFAEPLDKRTSVVIECLNVVFDKWGDSLSNDEWTQIWMSAFHGSPTQEVLEAILKHPNVHWSDGAVGQSLFRKRWNTHQWKDGFTVASLFWIARKAGWLIKTNYEIPERFVEEISVEFISDYIDSQATLPKHMLIESQTGSGKTRAIRTIWDKLGQPKSVIFVPTIKLATELYHTLVDTLDMPATLYRDDEKGKAIDIEDMKKAHILVTTLQTFATRLFTSTVDMRSYGLVYIEEIDQLLTGFALGGGNKYLSSHVNEKQARLGFQVLFEAFNSSGHVYGVDATMSQVSSALAFQMTDSTVRIIRNVDIKEKADVKFLSSTNEGYQIAYEALRKKKKVVIIADRADKANEAHKTMLKLKAVDKSKAILLNRHTSQQKKVIEFMRNVNEGAKNHDLVVYNSIMGSGVSITEVTPDVVIQICEYLPPRNNLQMLNRYRSQSEVYVVMRDSENLYAHTARDILKEATKSVSIEAGLIRLPVSVRTNIAVARDSLASVAIADQQAQWRSPYTLYQELLKSDGRKCLTDQVVISGVMEHTIKKIREIQKEQKKHIYANWHTVRPINEENPATADMSDMEVALGLHHGMIYKTLRGNVPEVADEEEANYVSEVVVAMRPHAFALAEFMEQDRALTRAERYVLDGDKPLIAVSTTISKITAVSLVSYLYKDMREEVEDTVMEDRAKVFCDKIRDHKDLYDSVVTRGREKYDMIFDQNDITNSAIALSRTLLRQIGLKQKKERVRKNGVEYKLKISNLNHVEDFLRWRNKNNPDHEFTYTFKSDVLDKAITSRQPSVDIFATMSESDKERVVRMVAEERCTVDYAIKTVHSGILM